MKIRVAKVDSKRRVVLPACNPGELMAVEETAGGNYTLTRIEVPKLKRKTRAAALRSMEESPLEMSMSWEELRSQTREP